MVFKPNSSSFQASSYLCICEKCQINDGQCSSFKEYQPKFCHLNKIQLWSEILHFKGENVEADKCSEDFLLPDTFCAVESYSKLRNHLKHQLRWLMITAISSLQEFLSLRDHYCKKLIHWLQRYTYKLSIKKTFFNESVVYPFV